VVVKRALAEQLKDPGSMKVQHVKIDGDGVLCGEVNAKNSFGGYAGFSKFFGSYFSANPEGKPVAIILKIDSGDDNGAAQLMCTNKGM
jgi:hypothetical protein